MTASGFATLLDARGYRPRPCAGGWLAHCPGHDDRSPSLSVGEGDDHRVLLQCFAGCQANDICDALGLSVSHLFADDASSVGRETRPQTRPRHTRAVRPKRLPHAPQGPPQTITATLPTLARYCAIPDAVLEWAALRDVARMSDAERIEWGCYRNGDRRPYRSGVILPVLGTDGEPVTGRHQIRLYTRTAGRAHTFWNGAAGNVFPVWGLHLCDQVLERSASPRLWIVEGVTDALTVMSARQEPALAILGASNVKRLQLEHLGDARSVVLLAEADDAGLNFAIRGADHLNTLGYPGDVSVVDVYRHPEATRGADFRWLWQRANRIVGDACDSLDFELDLCRGGGA